MAGLNIFGRRSMIGVPYVRFEVETDGKRRGIFAMDAYFVEFLSLEPRATVLIKDPSKAPFTENPEGSLPRLFNDDIESFLKGLYERMEGTARDVRNYRVSHMRRWDFLRIIGIPSGHHRHIAEEEYLARIERENSLGLAILSKVLHVRGSDDLDRVRVRELDVVYYRLALHGGNVVDVRGKVDKVYTQLLGLDPVFRTAFDGALFREIALTEEMKREASRFRISRTASMRRSAPLPPL